MKKEMKQRKYEMGTSLSDLIKYYCSNRTQGTKFGINTDKILPHKDMYKYYEIPYEFMKRIVEGEELVKKYTKEYQNLFESDDENESRAIKFLRDSMKNHSYTYKIEYDVLYVIARYGCTEVMIYKDIPIISEQVFIENLVKNKSKIVNQIKDIEKDIFAKYEEIEKLMNMYSKFNNTPYNGLHPLDNYKKHLEV